MPSVCFVCGLLYPSPRSSGTSLISLLLQILLLMFVLYYGRNKSSCKIGSDCNLLNNGSFVSFLSCNSVPCISFFFSFHFSFCELLSAWISCCFMPIHRMFWHTTSFVINCKSFFYFVLIYSKFTMYYYV